MSLDTCPRVLLGGTLIDGTGAPPLKDSVIVIENEYIMAAGKRSDIQVPDGSEVYNVEGMTILPGLIDSHCHFLNMGVSRMKNLQLGDTKTLEEALSRVKYKVNNSELGEWVIGRGWDESKWPDNRYLTKDDLDPIAPNNPVMLVRVCGHMVSINTKALELADITSETKPPDGGSIDKDENGEPTGVLRDCRRLVTDVIPPTTEEEMVEGLEAASELALRLGCTGVHDAGLGPKEIRAYQDALQGGELRVRAYLMMREEAPHGAVKLGLKTGFGDSMLRIGPAKLMMDGSLGARTAALFEPYEDDPGTSGLLLMEPERLKELVYEGHINWIQTATHAIGDLAIEHAIDAIDDSLRRSPRKDHRHRIEHCEILSSQQIERIARLGIVPDMQPNFPGEWSGEDSMYRQRLGEKRDRMNNPYRAMLDEGIPVAFGSDGMPFDPIYGIWGAVDHPIRENAIDLVEAVKCYTYNAAYASFQEDHVGSIEPGKLADIAVFDKELDELPREELKEASCYMTLVNGKILYHKKA
ncbi:amidohydrolase family protein [Candidatus Bathyarchaeota archaeon]|nr:amidohydrolase family protein [Candidatus Bathyarchaeota archaeon]